MLLFLKLFLYSYFVYKSISTYNFVGNVNDHHTISLSCTDKSLVIYVKYSEYFFRSKSLDATNKAKEFCNGKNVCSVSPGKLSLPDISRGDSKTLRIRYACIRKYYFSPFNLLFFLHFIILKAPFMKYKSQHAGTPITINCHQKILKVQHGEYGNVKLNCFTPNAEKYFKNTCSSSHTCTFDYHKNHKDDPCKGSAKYQIIYYYCYGKYSFFFFF